MNKCLIVKRGVEVAISLLANDKYMSVENMLRILGAVEEADSLKATENESAKEHSCAEMLEEFEE